MTAAQRYREVAEAAWTWVLGQVRGNDGPWLPEIVSDEHPEPADDRDSFYAGIGGLAPMLAEIAQYRELTDEEQALASGIVARLSAQAATREDPSLYDGLAGDATALRLLAPGAEHVALKRLLQFKTEINDLILGTAGVVLAAAWAGGEHAPEIMTTGGEKLLEVAQQTEAGLDWRMRPDYPASTPNYSHGTAGVATALAIAGRALERPDFIAAAVQGAQHLLSVGWLADNGFVVPHTLPYSTRDVEPVTYNWCHGPAGTSQLFAALNVAGVDRVGEYGTRELRQRCFTSVLTSGVPQRLRPGFWDNDGRCCGTAGVADILLDAAQDGVLDLGPAQIMADALLARAIRDESGTYWRFIEHRVDPPLLPPRTTWMQGATGIAAFLMRLARVIEVGPTAKVVDRPDQWWAVPEAVRCGL